MKTSTLFIVFSFVVIINDNRMCTGARRVENLEGYEKDNDMFTKSSADECNKGPTEPYERAKFWKKINKAYKLARFVHIHGLGQRVLNEIVFIPSGMGTTTVTAARTYRAERLGKTHIRKFSFENFPNIGRAITYSTNRYVPHCAAAATAILCAVKTRNNVLGCEHAQVQSTCNVKSFHRNMLKSLADKGLAKGKAIGLVTFGSIIHPLNAAFYAKTPNFLWNCGVPLQFKGCVKDVARQLVEDSPGKHFKVILGGGLVYMEPQTREPPLNWCQRTRNFSEVWLSGKDLNKTAYVRDAESLKAVDPEKVDNLLGLFADVGLHPKVIGLDNEPSLTDMVSKAVQILKKHKEGYILLVTMPSIERAQKNNYIKIELREVEELDLAVEWTVKNTNKKCTLIVVTADHADTLGFYGYASRDESIFGVPGGYSHSTLFYGFGFTEDKRYSGNSNINYKAPAHLKVSPKLFEAYRSGEDVTVYASGPTSKFFLGTYEQCYIGYILGYVLHTDAPSSSRPLVESSAVSRFSLRGYFLYLLLSYYVLYENLF